MAQEAAFDEVMDDNVFVPVLGETISSCISTILGGGSHASVQPKSYS